MCKSRERIPHLRGGGGYDTDFQSTVRLRNNHNLWEIAHVISISCGS